MNRYLTLCHDDHLSDVLPITVIMFLPSCCPAEQHVASSTENRVFGFVYLALVQPQSLSLDIVRQGRHLSILFHSRNMVSATLCAPVCVWTSSARSNMEVTLQPPYPPLLRVPHAALLCWVPFLCMSVLSDAWFYWPCSGFCSLQSFLEKGHRGHFSKYSYTNLPLSLWFGSWAWNSRLDYPSLGSVLEF